MHIQKIHYLLLLTLCPGQLVMAEISNLPDPTRPANYSASFSSSPVIARERPDFRVRAIRISEQDRSYLDWKTWVVQGLEYPEGQATGRG